MKTVKEIAEELGVSRQAVYKELRRQGLMPTNQPNGLQFNLSEEETNDVINAFKHRRKGGTLTTSQPIKLTTSQPDNRQLVDELTRQLSTKDEQIRAAAEQIKAKDEQIQTILERLEAAQNENKAILERLEVAQDMARTAQALHAGTMHQIEKQDPAPDVEVPAVTEPAPASTADPAPESRRAPVDPGPRQRWSLRAAIQGFLRGGRKGGETG